MKKVVAAAGVCAVGVAGLQGQNVTGLSTQEASKWWNISGWLRGFYDDNSLNSPKGTEEGGFGTEFSPGVSINLPLERTLLTASYRYTLNYYEAREDNNVDQDHNFDFRLNHKFTQRYAIDIRDTFVYSDAPAVFEQEAAQTVLERRRNSTGLRNYAVADFNARLTPTVGLQVGYKNHLRDYSETGFTNSLSALLDNIEHQAHLDAQWFQSQNTMLFVGYQLGVVDYTSSDSLGARVTTRTVNVGGTPTPVTTTNNVVASERNSLSHYLYLGGQRNFSRSLYGAARFGLQFADFYNADETSLSPYVDLTGTYAYLPGSSARLGLTIQRNSTDSGLGSDGSLTLDQESASVYATLSHLITRRIVAGLMGRYQYSVYNGGEFDGESDDYFYLDLTCSYKIRENLFAEAGYTWSAAFSDRPNSDFVRNRVYIGIRAAF